MDKKTGVYICHCGLGGSTEREKILEHLPAGSIVKDAEYLCSDFEQELLINDIKENGLEQVAVTCFAPDVHRSLFRKVYDEVGFLPYLIGIEETDDAVKRVVSALEDVKPIRLDEKEVDVKPSVLVIGAGIVGEQASLDIGDAGYKVYLVERRPNIGGHMAQLDKTFPTLDCASCIGTPKMVATGQHPNIELMTCSEVIEVSGHAGEFKVKVLRHPRYVDENECTGCGICVDNCPAVVPSEFNLGVGPRKAIYIPFAQAIPLAAIRDPEHCLGCRMCEYVCDKKAIRFDQKEEIVEFEVGSILVTTGFELFNCELRPELGYDKYDRVINALELERLCAPTGPTAGEILIHGKPPKNIVFVQCVGSRDKNVGNEYCSRVCCMYATKQCNLVREKVPDAKFTICYTDIRAFGKGHEEFYNRMQNEGVIYLRGTVSEVYRGEDGMMRVRVENTLMGEPVELEADLVVLSAGLTAPADTPQLANMLNLEVGDDKFLAEAHVNIRPMETRVKGIYMAGCAQGPKDISDSVSQTSGAAAKATIPISFGKVKIEPEDEIKVVKETTATAAPIEKEVTG
ncbi:heterodisulfide reductase subunit A [Candidatus Methanoperedenaceae archaeon GB37]|nr:heterodisulfide reductase subunit A [Candidatus Methanoperedenaceae archaeon GB37]